MLFGHVTWHRVVTHYGELAIAARCTKTGSWFLNGQPKRRNHFSWVDRAEIDLGAPVYPCSVAAKVGDKCVAGGDEFTVEAIEPATRRYPEGRVRGRGVWYNCQRVTFLG